MIEAAGSKACRYLQNFISLLQKIVMNNTNNLSARESFAHAKRTFLKA